MPPTWVQDEDIWKEAKKAAGTPKSKYKREPRTFTEREIGDLKYPSTDEYWATVTHIYEKMGGRIKTKAKAKTKEKKAMSLADRLRKAASSVEGTTAAGNGQDFADLLKKKWKGVKYNAKTRVGRASIGGLDIQFSESGNDPAVIVTIIRHPYLKTDSESMMKALDKIARIMNGL